MLEVAEIDVAYGDAPALSGVSVGVGAGEMVCVVGPNGAGKTTLVNAIARLLPVRGGRLVLDGEDVTRLDARGMCDRGVAIIPEGRRLFATMSVEENLEMGCYRRAARPYRTEGLDRVYALFPRLRERRRQQAGTLSGGEQQMVAIGRALMSAPRVLLLDEPFLGLAPLVVEEIRRALDALRAQGLTMLLVEQKLDIALGFTSRAYVLIKGRVALHEASDALARRPDLGQLYFELSRTEATA